MVRDIAKDWSSCALKAGGYLGSFQVDYGLQNIRGNRLVGPYYKVLKSKMLAGVPLKDVERSYHPFDLENIRRLRAGFVGKGGQYCKQYRIMNQFDDGFSTVQFLFNVRVDPFGIPTFAEGAMFDITAMVSQALPGPYDDLLNIAGHLSEAKRLAVRNNMVRLSGKIENAFDLAADIGLNRVLE